MADEAADVDAAVRSELEAIGEQPAIDGEAFAESVRAPNRRRVRVGMFVGVSIAVAIGAVFLITRSTGGQPRARATSAAPPTSSAVTTTQPPSASPPAPPQSVIVARLSFSSPCWVDAVADGQVVFVGTMTGGGRTIRARRALLLTLGNAGAVDLLVNGRRVKTGAAGQVVHLSVALKAGKVKVRNL